MQVGSSNSARLYLAGWVYFMERNGTVRNNIHGISRHKLRNGMVITCGVVDQVLLVCVTRVRQVFENE